MSEPLSQVSSSLPAVAFLVPLVAGALVLLGGGLGPAFGRRVSLVASLIVAIIGMVMVGVVTQDTVLTTWGNELRVDGLSALLVVAIGVIGFLTVVYSLRYTDRTEFRKRVGVGRVENRLSLYHALLLWFLGTMVWGCVTNNIIMLWVAVEATTLTSGLLVAFFWDRRALEAGYKYLMLLTIGITFALFGCVLIYACAAAVGQLDGRQALLISEVRNVASLLPPSTALLAVAFLLIGFGTKAGIAPFHPWLPDAHAEAPTPVSVLLSGVMIKMALYALARTVGMFFPSWPQITVFVVVLGSFTMVLGIIMALNQDDLKRLLAYSSVSQIGYVLAGVGLGTYLGCFGGLFHLLNHAIFKALLFMCAGAVIYATGLRQISELGGLARKMPVTSVCFVIGALAISGFPPFNGFWSKLTVYLALATSGLWWAAVIAVLTSVLTMVALLRPAYRVFWANPGASVTGHGEVRTVPASMWVPMVVLAAACVLLGIVPHLAYPLLEQAATALAALGR
ncbi:MAG: oxidoreductase [Gemmatimonadota bacterium]|nr:MAG: oxidoreductase [Gemmatimonadota bacterium]